MINEEMIAGSSGRLWDVWATEVAGGTMHNTVLIQLRLNSQPHSYCVLVHYYSCF